MIPRLFLDTNIIIDFLAHRQEFAPAANILQLGIDGKAELYMTGLTIANITYILRSQLGKDTLKDALNELCGIVHVSPITETEIRKAFATPNPDLEDAIQYYSAVAVGADYIISRDPKHFRYATIPVMNGKEFLEM